MMAKIICGECKGDIRFFNSQCICEEVRILKQVTAEIITSRNAKP